MATLPELWIPAVVFAHAFALLWLLKAARLFWPAAAARAVSKAAACWRCGCSERLLPCSTSNTSSRCDVALVLPLENPPGQPPALLRLEWQGVGCSYKTAAGERAVLQGVMGRAVAGEMQALIGPSGAGKSTLLDILACRKVAGGCVSGAVSLDGAVVQLGSYRRRVAYVPQEDCFVPVMTARETLQFHAAVRLAVADRSAHNCSSQVAPATPCAAPSPRSSWPAADPPLSASTAVLQPHHQQHHPRSCGRQQRVQQALEMVGLVQQGNTVVGGRLPGGLLLRGLSGGERRRLSIAAAFLATPAGGGFVFLDEPTSGLDSSAALSVMSHLQRLAASGQAVVAAIHQPRSAIWNLFDTATLLASGLVIYAGPTPGMLPWLSGRLGWPYSSKRHGLVSDWALDRVTVAEFGRRQQGLCACSTASSLQELQAAAEQFRASYEAASAAGDVSTKALVSSAATGSVLLVDAGESLPSQSEPFSRGGSEADFSSADDTSSSVSSPAGQAAVLSPPQPATCHRIASSSFSSFGSGGGASAQVGSNSRPPSWWQQYRALVWRQGLCVTRNPADVAGRTLTFAWVGLLVGLVYFNMPEDAGSIRQRLNVLFSTLCFFVLMPFISMSIVSEDKGLFIADTAAKLYRPSAYYAAKVTVVLPLSVLSSLCALCIQYGLTGLRPGAEHVIKHGTIATLVFLIAAQVLHLACTTMPNGDLAFMVAIGWTCVQMVMSGFFIPFKEMQLWPLANLRYLSAMAYALEGLLQVELGGRLFLCPPGGMDAQTTAFVAQLLPAAAKLLRAPAGMQQAAAASGGCVVDASAVVSYFGFSRGFGLTMAALGAYLVGMHLLTFVAMVLVARTHTKAAAV